MWILHGEGYVNRSYAPTILDINATLPLEGCVHPLDGPTVLDVHADGRSCGIVQAPETNFYQTNLSRPFLAQDLTLQSSEFCKSAHLCQHRAMMSLNSLQPSSKALGASAKATSWTPPSCSKPSARTPGAETQGGNRGLLGP